jgi:Uma2 family endonuclease
MSLAARKHTLISAADYLAAENDGAWRHEFVNGVVYAMAGASDRHNLARGNLAGLLRAEAQEPWQVFDAEMKVRIRSNAEERYYYPDVFVTCDSADRERYSRDHPVLIVEVLSPTTERIDRTEKFAAYRGSPTLIEYGLLSQDSVELELFRRRTEWAREIFVEDNVVTFESVGISLNVSRLYRGIQFEGRPQ